MALGVTRTRDFEQEKLHGNLSDGLPGVTALLHRSALKANSSAASARRGHGAPSLIGLREGCCLHPGVRPRAAGSA